MSAPMTMKQLGELIKHTLEHHSVTKPPKLGRAVKYLRPHIDCRDGACFAVTLHGFGWDQHFHTQNECRDLPESLDQRVRAFLSEPQQWQKEGTHGN